MQIEQTKKRISAIEQKQNSNIVKVFINIEDEKKEEIENYKKEHLHEKIVILNIYKT